MVEYDSYKHNLSNMAEDARVLVRAIMNFTKMVLLNKNIVEKLGKDFNELQDDLETYVKEHTSIYLRYSCISICTFFENPKKDIANLEYFLNLVANHIRADKIAVLEEENKLKVVSFIKDFKVKKKKYIETISKCVEIRNFRGAHNVGSKDMEFGLEEPSIFELREIVVFLVNSLQEIIDYFDYRDLKLGFIDLEFFEDHEKKDIESIFKDYGSLVLYSNYSNINSSNKSD